MDYQFCDFEIKEAGGSGEVTGYGSVFNNVDAGADVVEKGAFTESLAKSMPLMLWSHDFTAPPIGVWESAKEDSRGLLLKGRLFLEESDQIKLIHRGLKAGAVTGLSIGYKAVVQTFDDEKEIRRLVKVDLKEVSFVNFPMNDKARVRAVKGRQMLARGESIGKREFEAVLREAGFGREEAKAIVANGYDGFRAARGDHLDDVREISIIIERMSRI